MNIILEGPDAAGKTLYADKFVEHGYTYYKCSPGSHAKVSNLNKEYFEKLLEEDKMVFDRFCISELVFADLYEREKAITFEEANKILANAIIKDNKLIIFYASNIETLKERCIERGEFDYLEEIEKQNKMFANYAWVFAAYESENVIFIDVSKYNTIEDVNATVEKIIGG